jgi:hypothetical protein
MRHLPLCAPVAGTCFGSLTITLVLSLAGWPGLSLGATLAPSDPEEETAPAPDEKRPGSEIRYDRDIRPLLSDRCFTCHGPDEAKRKAELRLDTQEGAYRESYGIAAIVPGDLEASELWHRVTAEAVRDRMPPAKSNKKPLTTEELELVRRWIEQGARYEPHWSFVPPVRPDVPRTRDASWPRGEIDAFVLAELEARGVDPSPEADPRTLVRRVFLDLTGLPPTPEEIRAFLEDPREGRFESLVARLLHDEPYVSRYAERMAVPWLDAARYADTSGLHMDAGRQSWAWRDWVLQAFRDGMPYDRFLTEQMAGDLLPGASLSQRVASGFHRNHVTTDEGGAIPEEYLVEYAVDRASTTGAAFLGLTMGCARCHDHKYDPISHEEFYAFYSFFNSIEEPGLYSQVPDPERALEPFLEVPSPMQRIERKRLEKQLEERRRELDTPISGEAAARSEFFADLVERASIEWVPSSVVHARSAQGATLETRPDGSIVASGENPDVDTHVVGLETAANDLRLVLLEALPDPSLPHGRIGRAPNGNAVLESMRVEAVSIRDPRQRQEVRFHWAWADIEQRNGDFRAVNAIADDGLGWAVDAHRREGSRVAMFLAERTFGFEGGTRLEIRLDYDSPYAQHVLGRVRLSLGRIAPGGLDRLAAAMGPWYSTATFRPDRGEDVFTAEFGPERIRRLDPTQAFGDEAYTFNFVEAFRDERLNTEFAGGVGATYVARRVFVPSAREIEVSIGSDDGFRIYLDGEEIAKRRVDRGVQANQDRVRLALEPGEHVVVFKIVNTGGAAGYYWRTPPRAGELRGALVGALLPEQAKSDRLRDEVRESWRIEFSPQYRERLARVEAAAKRLDRLRDEIPRTMVMRELDEPRQTFVLERGEYDKPDETREVSRGIPAAFGSLPENAPTDRRGLALWMTSPENPLVARVAVNRLWELTFGTGIVATSEDFGMQGEWPSHPELLDWLAVEYRESGWDTKTLLERIVTSSTYRQSSRHRTDLVDVDPDDRWLARFPRRRLGAEEIRDQALYVAGILVEELGGASVKPYQPEGLWREAAMVQSNTRVFERGMGDDLWRRSLYTYWKRAAPPPSMLTFDAPTREFCTIRRGETTTPLQALVLWNDEQFVEAARMLAQRTLTDRECGSSDEARMSLLFTRCTGRPPDDAESAALLSALRDFRERYRDAREDAAKLLSVGEKPVDDELEPSELAAWTMIVNALFSLDSMICKG